MGDCGGDTIVSCAFALDNVVGIFSGFFKCPFDVVGGHFGEINQGFSADRGGADGGEGTVTVLAKDISVNALRVNLDGFGEVEAEAGGVEESTGAEDASGGKIGFLDGSQSHEVDGVGDHEDEGGGGMFDDFGNEIVDNLDIAFGQV